MITFVFLNFLDSGYNVFVFQSEITLKNYTTLLIESLSMKPKIERTGCLVWKTFVSKTSSVFLPTQSVLLS